MNCIWKKSKIKQTGTVWQGQEGKPFREPEWPTNKGRKTRGIDFLLIPRWPSPV